jgi:hypothetical protein
MSLSDPDDHWEVHVEEMKALLLPLLRQHFDRVGASFAEAAGVSYALQEVMRQVLAERGVKR